MLERRSRWVRAVAKAPVKLYRWNLGSLLGRRFLLLIHHGRRTGRRYETVLEVVHLGPDGEAVVVSGWGGASDWCRNLAAENEVEIVLGRRRSRATHRRLAPEEAAAVLAGYERRYRYARPVLSAVLSRLVGWHYDGSEGARTRLAGELPFVAFCPLPGRTGGQ